MNNQNKTALVTGANSGIGFETAAQLAEQGFGQVILVSRTLAKATAAKTELVKRTQKDVFAVMAMDLSEPDSVLTASADAVLQAAKIDVMILNAGMSSGTQPLFNSDGVELTFASTLIGHHVLTMQLLEKQYLSEHARIIIAGSEGARGNVPGMKVADFNKIAETHFGGDLEAALEANARIEPPYKFQAMDAYVTAKSYVAWWAAALARLLPAGMTVNAVSPGSAPATNFARNMPWFVRKLMPAMMALVGSRMGIAGPVAKAAQRYLDVASFDDETSGQFFASPVGKMVGELEIQRSPHLLDHDKQDAGWQAITRLAGGIGYPVAA